METPATGIAGAGNSVDRVGKPINLNLAPDSPKVERGICLVLVPPDRRTGCRFWERGRVVNGPHGPASYFEEGSGHLGRTISDSLSPYMWGDAAPLTPDSLLISIDGQPKRTPLSGYGALRSVIAARASMFGEAACHRLPGANTGPEMLNHAARLLALLAQAAANPEQPSDLLPLDVDALDKAAAAMVPALIEAAVKLAKGEPPCT